MGKNANLAYNCLQNIEQNQLFYAFLHFFQKNLALSQKKFYIYPNYDFNVQNKTLSPGNWVLTGGGVQFRHPCNPI
ncbi:hypothetical protein R83H12_02776 [Fibrobacteria bacterium R8-3-H12]